MTTIEFLRMAAEEDIDVTVELTENQVREVVKELDGLVNDRTRADEKIENLRASLRRVRAERDEADAKLAKTRAQLPSEGQRREAAERDAAEFDKERRGLKESLKLLERLYENQAKVIREHHRQRDRVKAILEQAERLLLDDCDRDALERVREAKGQL